MEDKNNSKCYYKQKLEEFNNLESGSLEFLKNIDFNTKAENEQDAKAAASLQKEKDLFQSGIKKEKELENQKLNAFSKRNDLLLKVKEEIDKKHVGDTKEKLTGFLVASSAFLGDDRKRVSLAINGDSSVGKDNFIESVLEQVPSQEYTFLTHTTQASMEDDIKEARIIALSELNLKREEGANKHLLEPIKQAAEGGSKAKKKDLRNGLKESRTEDNEQKSVMFGTTELLDDEELKTRFITITLKTSQEKIRTVHNKILEDVKKPKKEIEEKTKEENWIQKLIKSNTEKSLYVKIPFSDVLGDKINGKKIIDDSDPRSARDLKRLMSLVSTSALIHMQNRNIIEETDSYRIIEADPQDLLNIAEICGSFFNYSYSGLEPRLQETLNLIEDKWKERNSLQDELGLSSVNTVKNYCKKLSEMGLIEQSIGRDLDDKFDGGFFDSNKVYLKRCQKDVKRVLIGCQILELKEHLEEKTGKKLDTLLTPSKSSKNEGIKAQIGNKGFKQGINFKGINLADDTQKIRLEAFKSVSGLQFDTLDLTPYEKEAVTTDDSNFRNGKQNSDFEFQKIPSSHDLTKSNGGRK